MGELRKDYVLDRYVIIATDRGKRPDQFKQENKKLERLNEIGEISFLFAEAPKLVFT